MFVIPDILANAGGVTTSYFEWVQDRHGYFWEEEEVNERLEAKMGEAFDDVLKTSVKYKTDMRTAAYIVAINRVATVTKMRGHVRVTQLPLSDRETRSSSWAVLSPPRLRAFSLDQVLPRAANAVSTAQDRFPRDVPAACCTGTSAIVWPARLSSRAVTGGATPPGA